MGVAWRNSDVVCPPTYGHPAQYLSWQPGIEPATVDFWPMSHYLLWPNGCMYQETTWYGLGRPEHRQHCVRWGPSSPKGVQPQVSVNVHCGQTAG